MLKHVRCTKRVHSPRRHKYPGHTYPRGEEGILFQSEPEVQHKRTQNRGKEMSRPARKLGGNLRTPSKAEINKG